jgi:hypothetical protein
LSRNGEPDVSDSGGEPQAQGITDSSGNELQDRQYLAEVSFDDIDDGPGEPPGSPGGRVLPAANVPQALRSWAGIMLTRRPCHPV